MTDATNEAIKIIKRFEGFSARAYKCPKGVWTIGYGRTRQLHSEALFVTENDTTTEERESTYLRTQLLSKASWLTEKALKGITLSHTQLAALLSFLWNIGEGNFMTSTVRKLLLSNSYTNQELSAAWNMFHLVNGIPNKGLARRRKEEFSLFVS